MKLITKSWKSNETECVHILFDLCVQKSSKKKNARNCFLSHLHTYKERYKIWYRDDLCVPLQILCQALLLNDANITMALFNREFWSFVKRQIVKVFIINLIST
jgi:hypothetical protein